MPVYFGQNLILLDKLASGGMGEVFRARQTGTGGFEKIVAVKRILPQFAVRQDFARMFRAEMNLCARLQHPNIVQVFSNGHEQGYLYLVMEFVNGRTVAELLIEARRRHVRIPPEVSCFIVSEVAHALAYAHGLKNDQTGESLEIVHRDISPQNIMIGFQGEVKIVDFGIAKVAGVVESTKAGDLKGKVPYAAPEYIEEGQLDYRADIFALGVMFHELLAQRPLFVADSTYKTLRNVVEMPIPSLIEGFPDVKFEIEGIVMKALERDPRQRFQSAEEIARLITVFTNKMYPQFTRADFAQFVAAIFGGEDDPGMARLRDLHGYSKRVPADLVQGSTQDIEASVLDAPEVKRASRFTFSTFPRELFLIPIVITVAVLVVVFLLRTPEKVQQVNAADISGLVAWYHPKSQKEFDAAHVRKWGDAGWIGNDMVQLVKEFQPSLSPEPRHGINLIVFDGEDDFLQSEGLAATLARAGSMTMLVVARPYLLTPPQERVLWSAQTSGHSADVLRMGFFSQDKLRFKLVADQHSTAVEESAGLQLAELAVYVATVTPQGVTVLINGVERMAALAPEKIMFPAIATFSLGQAYRDGIASDFFYGEVAEFIAYSRAVEEKELARLARGTAAKYGIKWQGK